MRIARLVRRLFVDRDTRMESFDLVSLLSVLLKRQEWIED